MKGPLNIPLTPIVGFLMGAACTGGLIGYLVGDLLTKLAK